MLADERTGGSPQLARRLLWRLARPRLYRIIVLFVLAIVQTALVAATPWLVSLAIDTGIPAAQASNYWPLVGISTAIMACAAGIAPLSLLWRKLTGAFGQLVVFDLRTELFAKIQRLPVDFHDRFSSGRVIVRLTTDVESVNTLFGVTLAALLQAGLGVLMTAIAMLLLDARLAAITLAVLVPLAFFLVWMARRLSEAFVHNRSAIAEATVQVVESLNGARTAHAFRRQKRHDEMFAPLIERARTSGRQIQAVRGAFWTTLELTFSLVLLAVIMVGGSAVANGVLEIGVLAAFTLYISQFVSPLTSLSFILDALQSALTALAKLAEVLEQEPSVAEPRHPVALPSAVRGEVVFERVRFGYHATTSELSESAPAIRDMNLRLAPGQLVAMLGATGAGKSTIAKLIARFYDPTAGSILLDGVDLRHLSDRDLRGAVTMLTQDGFLFAGSVADNIRIGKPAATMDEIEAAATAVGADAFIRALPDGYQTDVRKRGTRLSAGQRQMVAFARAFLANPAVLILDEATSALDIPTERTMQKALRAVLAGRTALVIAHRLSTVEIADRVLVVADGRIVDDGTPAEMLAQGTGEFAALYRDGHGLSLER